MAGAMCSVAVLDEDDGGIPRSLRLFAARVQAEACRHAAAASQSAGSDLVRAFRGSATPEVPIRQFLERVHLIVRWSGDSAARHVVRIDGTCFVLAALYLHRFLQSPAAREAGILVEPATAHRLAAVAVFLGTKFGGHAPKKWTIVFELASGHAIRAAEMADLEERFLRAISFRLFVANREYDWFSRVLVMDSRSPRWSCATTVSSSQADATAGEEKGDQASGGSCTTSRCKRPVDVADGEEKGPLALLRLCSTSLKMQADAMVREEDRSCRVADREEKHPLAPRVSCATTTEKRHEDATSGEEKVSLAPPRFCSTSKKMQAGAMVREEDRRCRVADREKHPLAPRVSCTTTTKKRFEYATGGEEKGSLAPPRFCSTGKKRQADAMVREEDHRQCWACCLFWARRGRRMLRPERTATVISELACHPMPSSPTRISILKLL